MILTDREQELINLIRNYRRGYPNGSKMLEYEIFQLIDELLDIENIETYTNA